jgi:hypothetical protein
MQTKQLTEQRCRRAAAHMESKTNAGRCFQEGESYLLDTGGGFKVFVEDKRGLGRSIPKMSVGCCCRCAFGNLRGGAGECVAVVMRNAWTRERIMWGWLTCCQKNQREL